MKRGLKASYVSIALPRKQCYNPCPDEKGTERTIKLPITPPFYVVTILAPMKRGLKADPLWRVRRTLFGYNPCPDEKGTERSVEGVEPEIAPGYNPCPDEKGTERAEQTFT